MVKKLITKVFGKKDTIIINKVNVIEEFRKPVIVERVYGCPYYTPLFSRMVRRRMIESGQKYMKIEISAKKKDGSIISGVYDIPSYCACGIIDTMKKLEGREVSVWMKHQLPRRLPYMSF